MFLDIQGVFDTIRPERVKEMLIKHGGDQSMVDWYYNYLTHRNLNANVGGYDGKVSINIGFPQGGVCSAKFWIIAFNRAVEIINEWGMEGQGFADDLCALTGGTNLEQVIANLQLMLKALEKWGNTNGLIFSPEKTVAMMFNKKNRKIAQQLKLYGKKINYVDTTKYLGITIDNKLMETTHPKQN